MLTTFLVLLALVGGVAVTVAMMDGPRRQAQQQLRRLAREREDLQQERDDLEAKARADAARVRARNDDLDAKVRGVEARARSLATETAQLEKREADLRSRLNVFSTQVIQYDDLAKENRLLTGSDKTPA